ncbi:MAG: SUMF1/EgtB/PvdO family nonheme iron enzyme [Microcoleaceae cyanobacterium MO_207.B10]|nr:SUMF1/EgtB/PvdO family nonheme iron enzyme [Microcoleaceae cyanobacterium MO_207.B10]
MPIRGDHHTTTLLLKKIEAVLSPLDITYVDSVNKCLKALADEAQLSVVNTYYNRAIRHCQAEAYQAGIDDFNIAIFLNPQFIDAYYHRANAYVAIEKYQEAISDYNQVLELQPNHSQAYNNRGKIYQEVGEEQKAKNDYEKAQNLKDDSEEKSQYIIQEVLNERTEQRERDSVKKAALTDQCSQVQKNSITQKLFFGIVSLDSQGNEINQEQKTVNQKIENLSNEIKLEMVYIPAGNFIMGASSYEAEKEPYELPQHQVSLESFYMSKYPITQAQWELIMGTKPAEFPGENRPVENVSWYDAVEFCQHLYQKTGTVYRLPSEAQWEYACRGGTTSPYHFGETITITVANYNGQYNYKYGPQGIHHQQTTNVGSFVPNAFGLFDMHGNVWEWCADPWHDNYYGAVSDGSVWELDGDNSRRVVRGGTWCLPPKYCRSAFRASYVPDGKRSDCGFRVVFSTV